MSSRHLSRNPNDAWIAGVCGGIARWLGWEPSMVRLLCVLAWILSGVLPGILAYIVLCVLMPIEE